MVFVLLVCSLLVGWWCFVEVCGFAVKFAVFVYLELRGGLC